MPFRNRLEAGRLLGSRLASFAGKNPLVLAIPRGGVPVGHAIVEALGGQLDVVLVHKLRSPNFPELAIGAVAEDGQVLLAEGARSGTPDERRLREEIEIQKAALLERRRLYTPVRTPVDPFRRIVIVVDDGLATGFTMIAALRATRLRRPARLVAAVPVAPPDTLRRLTPWTNEIVCLETHPDFEAVSRYYGDFSAVTDDEVVEFLRAVPHDPSITRA